MLQEKEKKERRNGREMSVGRIQRIHIIMKYINKGIIVFLYSSIKFKSF